MTIRRDLRHGEHDWHRHLHTVDGYADRAAWRPEPKPPQYLTWRDVGYFLLGSFAGSLGLVCILMFIAAAH